MTQKELIKRDNLIVNLLKEHKGRDNPILTKDILDYLKEQGYEYSKIAFKAIISKLRYERHLPICYIGGGLGNGGYFWAKTQQELKDMIALLESRIAGTQGYINLLKDFVIE